MIASKIFQNPFVLGAKGFLAGAILFWTFAAPDVDAAAPDGSSPSSIEKLRTADPYP